MNPINQQNYAHEILPFDDGPNNDEDVEIVKRAFGASEDYQHAVRQKTEQALKAMAAVVDVAMAHFGCGLSKAATLSDKVERLRLRLLRDRAAVDWDMYPTPELGLLHCLHREFDNFVIKAHTAQDILSVKSINNTPRLRKLVWTYFEMVAATRGLKQALLEAQPELTKWGQSPPAFPDEATCESQEDISDK